MPLSASARILSNARLSPSVSSSLVRKIKKTPNAKVLMTTDGKPGYKNITGVQETVGQNRIRNFGKRVKSSFKLK